MEAARVMSFKNVSTAWSKARVAGRSESFLTPNVVQPRIMQSVYEETIGAVDRL